ncbi:MAG: DUF4190 domain-containing protein [Planctomycetota bacterium]
MNDPNTDNTDGQNDGIAGLAKMSTTAGLGHEYRAVSAVAVTALSVAVVGLSALLVDALLILPVLALVLGVVALVRIRQSGGTLTGVGVSGAALAIGGLVLVVAGSSVFGRWSQQRGDTARIEETIGELRSALTRDDYATAYTHTAPRFRDRFPASFFSNVFDGMQGEFGNLTDLQTTGLIRFDESEQGIRYAQTQLIFTVENREDPLRHNAIFTSEAGGTWQLSSLQDVFE